MKIAVREKGGVRYLFVLTYGNTPAAITLKQPVNDLFADEASAAGVRTLEKYEARVYENFIKTDPVISPDMRKPRTGCRSVRGFL